MISVEAALSHVFDLVTTTATERVPLVQAAGRVLAEPVSARRSQPPFPASAMDGYAVDTAEAEPGAQFKVIGTAAAGHGFSGHVGPGQAVRIFTGAPLPVGASRVVIQENVTRNGTLITLNPDLDAGPHIRPAGDDFAEGARIDAPRRLGPADLSFLAAMNVAQVPVHCRPNVALIATGDELVMPGEDPGPDQIIASNTFGLKALLEADGGDVRMLPIARDSAASLEAVFALAEGADLIVTSGGASVGDHDIVRDVAGRMGMKQAFYKVAMRPGKPLMAGRLGSMAMIGLPGNPVSSIVCAHIFVRPALRAMQGMPAAPLPRQRAPLAVAIDQNGPREHYMRADLTEAGLIPFDRQDSALLSVLAKARALLIRPPHDPARKPGEVMHYIPL